MTDLIPGPALEQDGETAPPLVTQDRVLILPGADAYVGRTAILIHHIATEDGAVDEWLVAVERVVTVRRYPSHHLERQES